MLKQVAFTLALGALTLAAPSCGPDEPELRRFTTDGLECSPGEEEPCLCEGGAFSTRPCDAGRWGACDCAVATCDNLNGENCATATMNAMPEGTLACGDDCHFDTSDCSTGTGNGSGGSMGAGGTVGAGGTLGAGGGM
jgi:hypothetical protein